MKEWADSYLQIKIAVDLLIIGGIFLTSYIKYKLQ
ncbi:hypothetical protein M3_0125 [Lysinibacillus phage vB_LfM_LysYB1]|nr:hypothetical protein M3_0125 [Lysinibacillus phage vB_LfM_LysYB1]WAB25365.1 hypothetical protein M5_0187 [Lysinibacillus phage vB_LfM_LysYB2]